MINRITNGTAKPNTAPLIVYADADSRSVRLSSTESGRPKRGLAPSTSGNVTTIGKNAKNMEGNESPPPSNSPGNELIASAMVTAHGKAQAATVPQRTYLVNAHIAQTEQPRPQNAMSESGRQLPVRFTAGKTLTRTLAVAVGSPTSATHSECSGRRTATP